MTYLESSASYRFPSSSSATNSPSSITTCTVPRHLPLTRWQVFLIVIGIIILLNLIRVIILCANHNCKSPWIVFLRDGTTPEEALEREKRKAELQAQREEGIAKEVKSIENRNQEMADMAHIHRFRKRISLRYMRLEEEEEEEEEDHIAEDYARFQKINVGDKCTDMEIFQILIKEFEKKYGYELNEMTKNPRADLEGMNRLIDSWGKKRMIKRLGAKEKEGSELSKQPG